MMNKYRVSLQGKNFLLNFGDHAEKHGFYTTRYIEAENQEDAEKITIELIRKDPDLNTAVLNKQDDPHMIYAEEIVQLVDFENIKPPESGYTFYPEG